MFMDGIIELLDLAINCNGKLKIPQHDLDSNTFCNQKQKHIGKPLCTMNKKHDFVYSYLFTMTAYFPCVSSSNRLNAFQKNYMSNAFMTEGNEFYLDLFSIFNLSNKTNDSFIELKEFFVSYKNLILMHDNNKIYLQFNKETAPVRIEVKVQDKQENSTLTQDEISLIENTPFSLAVNDWLKLFSESPFFKKNRWCWFAVTHEGLLNLKESRVFMKKWLRDLEDED